MIVTDVVLYLNRSKLASTRLCNNHIIIIVEGSIDASILTYSDTYYWATS